MRLRIQFLIIAIISSLVIPGLYPTLTTNALTASGTPQVAWATTAGGAEDLTGSNFTCRWITRPSIAGNTIRIHLTNFFGAFPETFNAVTVALRTSGAAVSNSITPVTFGGQRAVTIPAHDQITSDPIAFTINAQQDMAVSMYFPGINPTRTSNNVTMTTSYCTDFGGGAGDHTNDPSSSPFINSGNVVWWVNAVDVYQTTPHGAIVALGDSITDGLHSDVNSNNRWTDVLSSRLLSSSNPKSVANEGRSGDTACPNSGEPQNGGVNRVSRDALALANVSDIIFFMGTNDLGRGSTADAITACYQNIIDQAHAAGVRIIGATIMPRGLGLQQESYRIQANNWIKTPGHFDGVIDFDTVIRDPNNPVNLNPAYDPGDHLHPNAAGHAAMANAIPLALFSTGADNVVRYEAESPSNILAGGANIVGCLACSNGAKVGGVGNNSGTLTFNGIAGPTSQITVYYVNGDSSARTAQVSVNGGVPITVSFGPTGDWFTPKPQVINLTLNSGSNMLKFSNNTAGQWSPDFDRITVTGYEAESPSNTLVGGANVAGCSACSNGAKVGGVGNNSGMLTFNGVTGSALQITVYYVNGDSSARTAQVSVNGGAPITVSFSPTGDWYTPRAQVVNVTLNAGSNSIRFSNNTVGQWAPDFDRIVVSGYEAESPSNTLASGANVAICPGCSNGAKVGGVGNNSGTLTFNGVAGPASQITVYYVNGDSSARTAQVSVNGGAPITVSFSPTTDWFVSGTQVINLTLNAGSNSIRFSNNTVGQWAPDFDRIVIQNTNGATPPPPPTFIPPTSTPPGAISTTAWYNVINQNSSKCVDSAGFGTTDGTKVIQWGCGTGVNQQWQFQPADSGYYKVVPRHATSLGWDVTGGPGATGDSALMELWTYGGGTNQQWQPVALGGGYYKFIARNSGKCLEVPAWSTADGTQLTQYTCNGGANQAFRLTQQP